jgi:Calx-beta domain-containing protein
MTSRYCSRAGLGLLLASLLGLALLGVLAPQPRAQTPPPSFSITDVTKNEGNSGTTSFVFRVTISNYPASGNPTFRVDYATASGTAAAGACASGFDYVRVTNTQLTFNRNNQFRDITVSVCGDTTFEPNETFFVDLSTPTGGAVIGKGRGTGTIVNDDVAPVRPTATNVTCAPATVPVAGPTTCTATVTDTGAGTATTPQGIVTFSLGSDPDGDAGTFVPLTCTLTGGSGGINSCSVSYVPTARGDGTHAIGASYAPTGVAHSASSDPSPFQLAVLARTTATTLACPASTPANTPATCMVTVKDTDAGAASPPVGTVDFTVSAQPSGSTATAAPDPCTLAPDATTVATDDSTCMVTFTANTVGNYTLQGAYQPAPASVHAGSTGSDTIEVTARTTNTEVTCTPSSFQAGDSTTCTATVSDTDDAPRSTPAGTVTWTSSESTGAFVPSSCVLQSTNPLDAAAPASCSVTYSSTKASQQTITASYGGSPIHEASSGSTTVTVKPGPPAKVTVDPPAATNPVDTEHCVTATVTDRFDNPTPDITVVFSVTGSNTASGSRTTGPDGQTTVAFCYTGVLIGITDVISAFADFNPENGTHDPGEPVGVATKIWEIPLSTPLCEVIVTQGGWLIAQNGDRGTFGGNAQVSSTGEPNGQEQYQDHGPAQSMNVNSTEILAVTCSDDLRQASIFGLATIDGSGQFAFRIDVRDLGEPGVGQDTYRMRILGYDSGEPGTLLGGNVQIHKA